MQVTVKKWGNSPAVRLPASVFRAARLSLDQALDVREENGRIVLEPVTSQEYDLDVLLDTITPENCHPLIDMGPPVGREMP